MQARHVYVSALNVADYLGHADPGFTLRVFAHLFPNSEDRARQAIDSVFQAGAEQQSVTG